MALPFDFICPNGTHIKEFDIGSGAVINSHSKKE